MENQSPRRRSRRFGIFVQFVPKPRKRRRKKKEERRKKKCKKKIRKYQKNEKNFEREQTDLPFLFTTKSSRNFTVSMRKSHKDFLKGEKVARKR